ncbi:MAG: hypothetical protein BZY88_01570 [SAR202 cluster bacterium Io17-Chloro-G9]|nr:MAG: hypothetical protein BZY88_01570 [SAR202 cluster bacterium Io17-Chloro-G9]
MTIPEHEEALSEEPTVLGEDETIEAGTDSVVTPDEVEPEPEVKVPPNYYISFPRLEQLKRSPVVLVAARRVQGCPSMSRPDSELKDAQALVTEIAQHYQEDEDFIRTDMPMMEIVFRILLSRRNRPMSLTDLHYELTERWATPVRPLNISESGLQKILEGDNYYGFARSEPR